VELNQPLKGMSQRERREYLWLMKVRTVPQFRELVARLSKGESVWATTAWFMEQPNRGELSNCSFETVRKYLTSLSIRIKQETPKINRIDLSDLHKIAVNARVEAQLKAAVALE
jgi:hypothetical protein